MKHVITYVMNETTHVVIIEALTADVAAEYLRLEKPGINVLCVTEACADSIPDMIVPEARYKGAGMGDYLCTNCDEVSDGRMEFCPHCHAHMSNPLIDEEDEFERLGFFD